MTESPPTDPLGNYRYDLRIPKDRIAVVVGPKGKVKKSIEKGTDCKITIDSSEGDVFIEGSDGVQLLMAREIVHAIGRGFNPDIALLLMKQDYTFELIHLTEYSRHKNHQQRLKGRVIGKNGRSRATIEQSCDAHICVYGKTIGVIAQSEHCAVAARAVQMLLDGAPHGVMYKWLEKKSKALRRDEMLGVDKTAGIKEEFQEYVE